MSVEDRSGSLELQASVVQHEVPFGRRLWRPHLLCWSCPISRHPECPAVAGSPDAALRQGSQQSQASREQGAQRSPEEHQRGSPAPRKRTKRVGCSRREPGDADPTMQSRKSRCQEEEGEEGPVRRGADRSRARPSAQDASVEPPRSGSPSRGRLVSRHQRPGPFRAADRAAAASFVGLAGPEVLPGVPLCVQASRSTRKATTSQVTSCSGHAARS